MFVNFIINLLVIVAQEVGKPIYEWDPNCAVFIFWRLFKIECFLAQLELGSLMG